MSKNLTPKQVALAIGVSEASLKRWCDKGLLPSSRTAGGHRRLPLSGVIQYLRDHNQPLVRPEILGLPPSAGAGDAAIDRALDCITEALAAGDFERFRRLVFTLYLAGHELPDLCDRVLAEAFHALGDQWQHGDLEVYQERLGCEMCMRVLYELRNTLASPAADAPVAIGATLSGDFYTLPTTMIEVVLRSAGWRAESLGAGHPVHTLCNAIRQRRPRMMWLSVSYYRDFGDLVEACALLHRTAVEHNTAFVLGGRALDEDMRRELTFTAHCDTLRHLVAFTQTLNP